MLFPPETERACLTTTGQVIIYIANKAFSRQKPKVLSGLSPCGVLKQAARLLFSCGRGIQISGFS
jgi:hypothetical protein